MAVGTIAVALMAAPGAAQATPVQDAIMAAMADSAAGWNAGDLDRFVAIYAPDATFVTKTGLLRDRRAIAEHYRASFADGGNARGRLSFQPLAWRAISNVHQLLIARWTLAPASGAAEAGVTTLLFERRADGWRIIADHSS